MSSMVRVMLVSLWDMLGPFAWPDVFSTRALNSHVRSCDTFGSGIFVGGDLLFEKNCLRNVTSCNEFGCQIE